jgi:phosphatidylglycerol:prolipoprotein diacylglycerol transferase
MIFWDPSPIAFTVPGLDLSIAWYGILFASGFWIATRAGRRALQRKAILDGKDEQTADQDARRQMDQLVAWCMVGTVIGARLVHCLAYDPAYYLTHPISILYLREGGLASHGGIAGIVLALIILAWRQKSSPWVWFDLVGLVYAWPAVAIRLGNFVNQEILGIPTGSDWGVVFLHPVEQATLVPRHPAQLYEALSYAVLGMIAWIYWKRGAKLGTGQLAGLGLLGAFAARFALEWCKIEQAHWGPSGLTLGQWLSIPCMLAGWWMLRRHRTRRSLPT